MLDFTAPSQTLVDRSELYEIWTGTDYGENPPDAHRFALTSLCGSSSAGLDKHQRVDAPKKRPLQRPLHP